MAIDYPLKEGDYTVIDDPRVDFENDYGELDASTIIDPQEYDVTQVSSRQYQNDLTEKPQAGNWFNLSETEGSTSTYSNKNYWSINKDVVFYLIQAGKTDGVIWTFMVAPASITITKNMDYNPEPNWASNERTITYGGTSMKKISLGEILIEGLATKTNITKKINNLEKLLDPVQYKKHIAPLVFELVVKPKGGLSQESRSYGNFLITNLSLNEILRSHQGRPLRVVATLELQEVPKYQINDGRDLTLPDNLVVKVDKTAKDQLDDQKDTKADGSTDKDVVEGKKTTDILINDANGNLVKGTRVVETKVIDGKQQQITTIYDSKGKQVGSRQVVFIDSSANKVNKTQGNPAVKSPYIRTVNQAPAEG